MNGAAPLEHELFDLRSWLDIALRESRDRSEQLLLLRLALASSNSDLASAQRAKGRLAPRPVTVSLTASGALALQVDAHPITIPATERGVDALVRLLEARSRDQRPTVDKESSPIQRLVDNWLKNNEPRRTHPALDMEGIDL